MIAVRRIEKVEISTEEFRSKVEKNFRVHSKPKFNIGDIVSYLDLNSETVCALVIGITVVNNSNGQYSYDVRPYDSGHHTFYEHGLTLVERAPFIKECGCDDCGC